MEYSNFPILSLLIFSPLLGIALCGVFRETSGGLPSKLVSLLSSIFTFLLSISLLFYYKEDNANIQLVEKYSWISDFNIEYFIGLDGLNLFFLIIISFIDANS